MCLSAGWLVCLASSSDDQLLLPPSPIPCNLHELCHFGLGRLHILPQTQSEFVISKLNFSSSLLSLSLYVSKLPCSYLLIMSVFLGRGNVKLIDGGVFYRTKTRPVALSHHPELLRRGLWWLLGAKRTFSAFIYLFLCSNLHQRSNLWDFFCFLNSEPPSIYKHLYHQGHFGLLL